MPRQENEAFLSVNPDKEYQLINHIRRNIASIALSWEKPPGIDEKIKLPQQGEITSNTTISMPDLKRVIFGELVQVPDLPISSRIEEVDPSSQSRTESQNEQKDNTIILQRPDRSELKKIYMRRGRQKISPKLPLTKEEAEKAYKGVVLQTSVPAPQNISPDSSRKQTGSFDQAIAIHSELVESPHSEGISDYPIKFLMIRGYGGEKDNAAAIRNQGLQLQMEGVWSYLKFADSTNTEVIPVIADGTSRERSVTEAQFLNPAIRDVDPESSESFEGIHYTLAKFREAYKGSIIIPMLAILNGPFSDYYERYYYGSQIAIFMRQAEIHFGLSIILEPPNKQSSILELLKEVFANNPIPESLILSFGEKSAYEGITTSIDYMLDNMKVLRKKAKNSIQL